MGHVVELAADEVAENPEATKAMREFSSIRVRDAEQKGNKVFEKYGLTAPVPIDRVNLGDGKHLGNFPYIKFSSWMKFLLGSGRLPQQLCAAADLESMQVKLKEFWNRYETIYPNHGIFSMRDAGLDLGMVVPVYSHSDEGRGYKKTPFWLFSTHGCIGRGTRAYLKKGKDKVPLKRCGFGLNFTGHTMGTHFLFAGMQRKLYKKKPQALDNLVGVYARDMEHLLVEGVCTSDGVHCVRFCHLGTKGDLPALTRLGNMLYSFGNVPKAARSRKPCRGICWMCCAGQESDPANGLGAIPFEDTAGKPLWEATLGQRDPWQQTPSILEGVPMAPVDQWEFFKTDVWHNFHMGLAKHWVASSMVSLLENLDLPFTNMDDKIDFFNQKYKSFCKRKRLSPHHEEFGRETLGWYQLSTCPVGSWNKGSASTHYMLFLEDLLTEFTSQIEGEPLLETIVPGIGQVDLLCSF